MARQTPTIAEIARRANVSKAAVSLVINGKPGVSKATIQTVRDVMAEMDYVPSALAQRFASQKSMAVALVALAYERVFHDERHAEMVDAVYTKLDEHDYSLILGTANNKFLEQKRHTMMLRSGQVDGMILLEPTLDQDYLGEIAATCLPAVVLNGDGTGRGLDSVRTDDCGVGIMAAKHLYDLGHRRIGMITGSMNHASGRDRRSGFEETCRELGHPLSPDRLILGEYDTSEVSGREGCKQILHAAPDTTAIFCGNSAMALNAISIALEMGLTVPEDLSILGVDDSPFNLISRPPLSAICQQSYQMATAAAELLLDRMNASSDESGEPREVLIGARLVERATCAQPLS